MMDRYRLSLVLLVSLLTSPAEAARAVFQFEALGAFDDWVVIRENIPASPSDTNACRYPGLDPSEYVGAVVHFVQLPAEAKRGRLLQLDTFENSITIYARGRDGEGCTSAGDAERHWSEVSTRASSLGITLSASPPPPLVFGAPVPAKSCVLIHDGGMDRHPCESVFKYLLDGKAIQIAVSLTAVPEAPDGRSCQFVGHRFGAVIQVAGLDFGTMGSVAPGGFTNHYDCRSQQFDPLRLYRLGGSLVLIGGFCGTNIADRGEHPFLVVFPTRPAP